MSLLLWPRVMLLFVLLASFAFFMAARDSCVKASAVTSPCATELEQALFRPKVCGVDYFKNLACELNSQILSDFKFGGQRAAQLCLRFSKEYQVGLSMLNAKGLDMCTLRNPTANLMAMISELLLYRSSASRKAIYDYYSSLYSAPFPPVPSAESQDIDSIGMLWLYFSFAPYIDQGKTNIDPYIVDMLAYIRGYPEAGLQSSIDLTLIHDIAYITASVPAEESSAFMTKVFAHLGITAIFVDTVSVNTVTFLAFALRFATLDDSFQELPLPIRVQNYLKQKNFMLYFYKAQVQFSRASLKSCL